MKVYIVFLFLLIVLPAFLEASPKAWWRRRRPQPRPRPRPRPVPRPRYGSYHHLASCTASGDPHYKTFDNKRYNFMGECNYVFVTDHCKVECGRPRLGTFRVTTENINCGRRVSCVKSVTVDVKGSKIHLTRGHNRNVYRNTAHFTVHREGNFVVVRSNPTGLVVKWDGNMGIHVYLTNAYRGKVCGLCGNYDGNGHNDFIMSSGKINNDINTFAKSWQAGGKCANPPVTPKHPCERNSHLRQEAEKDCAVIKSSHFSRCKAAGVDTDALYRNCLYDVCNEKTASFQESSCEAIKEASQECKDQTGQSVSWGHLADKCKCQKKVHLYNSYQGLQCCVFPFTKNGVTHYDCVKGKQGLWCSSQKVATSSSIGKCVVDSYQQR